MSSGTITALTVLFFLVCIDAFIRASPLFGTTIEVLGYGILAFCVMVAIAPFTTTFIPQSIKYHQDEQAVTRYLDKQWRYGQALLSIALVGAIGGSIPALSGTTDSVGYLGILSLIGVLFTPFLAGTLVIAYRIHLIEKYRRSYFTQYTRSS